MYNNCILDIAVWNYLPLEPLHEKAYDLVNIFEFVLFCTKIIFILKMISSDI